jgi:hypothetical protein
VIEVTGSQETVNIFDSHWSWPLYDSFNFYSVHFDFALSNDDAEVFHLFLVEGTFLGFEEEVMVFDLL